MAFVYLTSKISSLNLDETSLSQCLWDDNSGRERDCMYTRLCCFSFRYDSFSVYNYLNV